MKLIRELCEAVEYVTEKAMVNGVESSLLKLKGPMLSTEPNRNKRIYSEQTLRPVVDKFLAEKVKSKTAWGELGHPTGQDGPKIHESNVSHLITDLRWEGKHVIGECTVMPYGPGLMLKGMIEIGGKPGMSTRGLGSVKANDEGLQEVQSDYRLITIDAVTDPSGPGCFVEGIMEGVDWIYDATTGTYMESKVEQFVDTVKKMSKTERGERAVRLMEYYVENLKRLSVDEGKTSYVLRSTYHGGPIKYNNYDSTKDAKADSEAMHSHGIHTLLSRRLGKAQLRSDRKRDRAHNNNLRIPYIKNEDR